VAYFSCDKRRLPLMGKLKGIIFTEAVFTLARVACSEVAGASTVTPQVSNSQQGLK